MEGCLLPHSTLPRVVLGRRKTHHVLEGAGKPGERMGLEDGNGNYAVGESDVRKIDFRKDGTLGVVEFSYGTVIQVDEGNALPFRKGCISEPFEYLSRLDGRIAAPFCEQDFSFRVAADILNDSLAALGGSRDRVGMAGHQIRLDQYRSLAGN